MLGEHCARASAWGGSGATLQTSHRASWRQAAAGSGGGASDPSAAGPPARTLNCSVEYQAACPVLDAGRSQGRRGLLLVAQAAPRAALHAGSVLQGPRRCARVRSIGAGPAVGGGEEGWVRPVRLGACTPRLKLRSNVRSQWLRRSGRLLHPVRKCRKWDGHSGGGVAKGAALKLNLPYIPPT